MAGFFQKLFGTPKPPAAVPLRRRYTGPGVRGQAWGSLAQRAERARVGKHVFTDAEAEAFRSLPDNETEAFLHDGLRVDVHSTLIRWLEYDLPASALTVGFLDGATWQYTPVTFHMAEDLAHAASKGSWLWDHLRVRGPGHAHDHQPGISARPV